MERQVSLSWVNISWDVWGPSLQTLRWQSMVTLKLFHWINPLSSLLWVSFANWYISRIPLLHPSLEFQLKTFFSNKCTLDFPSFLCHPFSADAIKRESPFLILCWYPITHKLVMSMKWIHGVGKDRKSNLLYFWQLVHLSLYIFARQFALRLLSCRCFIICSLFLGAVTAYGHEKKVAPKFPELKQKGRKCDYQMLCSALLACMLYLSAH